MACVGACPEGALLDAKDTPQLKFIERNCVQCGLCEKTCPEKAIALTPRLLLDKQAKAEVVLNKAEPFNCVRCNQPFGTQQMIASMLGRLQTHSMFSGDVALRRLQMCADCRVIDMMENTTEATILDQPAGKNGGAGLMSATPQSLDAEYSVTEDSARAGCYALIGRLFYAAPDADLLDVIRYASTAGGPAAAGSFAPAWDALQSACCNAEVDVLRRGI